MAEWSTQNVVCFMRPGGQSHALSLLGAFAKAGAQWQVLESEQEVLSKIEGTVYLGLFDDLDLVKAYTWYEPSLKRVPEWVKQATWCIGAGPKCNNLQIASEFAQQILIQLKRYYQNGAVGLPWESHRPRPMLPPPEPRCSLPEAGIGYKGYFVQRV